MQIHMSKSTSLYARTLTSVTVLLMLFSENVTAHGNQLKVPDTGLLLDLSVEQHLLSDVSGEKYQLTTPLMYTAESLESGVNPAEIRLSVSTQLNGRWMAHAAISNHSHDGETGLELDQGFIQGNPLSALQLRAGQFYSSLGYYNEQGYSNVLMPDAPLIYHYALGGELRDNGLRASLSSGSGTLIGIEAFSGTNSISGEKTDDFSQTQTLYLDQSIDLSSWGHLDTRLAYLFGQQNYQTSDSSHSHGDSDLSYDLSGEFDLWILSGRWQNKYLQLSGEFFQISRDTEATTSSQLLNINDRSSGFYSIAAFRISPQWQILGRYDRLTTDLSTDGHQELISEFGLPTEKTPERVTMAINWQPENDQFWSLHVSQTSDLWQDEQDSELQAGISYHLNFSGETL